MLPVWVGFHHLQPIGGGTGGFEQRQRRRLRVEGVERRRLARLPAARPFVAGHHDGERRVLGVGRIAPSDLEQADAGCAAILVALRGGEQAGEQRRAHDLQVFADRVGERPRAAARGAGSPSLMNDQVGGLVEPGGGRGTAEAAFGELFGSRGRFCDAVRAR